MLIIRFSSLLAVAQACSALNSGDCTVAIAGGASVTFPNVSGYIHEEGNVSIFVLPLYVSFFLFDIFRFSPKMVTVGYSIRRLAASLEEMVLE